MVEYHEKVVRWLYDSTSHKFRFDFVCSDIEDESILVHYYFLSSAFLMVNAKYKTSDFRSWSERLDHFPGVWRVVILFVRAVLLSGIDFYSANELVRHLPEHPSFVCCGGFLFVYMHPHLNFAFSRCGFHESFMFSVWVNAARETDQSGWTSRPSRGQLFAL